jgi:hypothetical protein
VKARAVPHADRKQPRLHRARQRVRHLYMNPAISRITGCAAGFVARRSGKSACPPRPRPNWIRCCGAAGHRPGKPRRTHLSAPEGRDSINGVQCRFSSRTALPGRLAIASDITARRKMENHCGERTTLAFVNRSWRTSPTPYPTTCGRAPRHQGFTQAILEDCADA